MSGDLSRRSSRAPPIQADDTTSLTSFPDPADSASPPLQPQSNASEPLTDLPSTPDNTAPGASEPVLNGLLDSGPSMFDEQDGPPSNPQSLSSASTETLRRIIDHRGAVELVRNLSALLAERDAHVTALTRLAQEWKIPANRIAETANRVKQAERRRLSLAAAASEELVTTNTSESSDSTMPEPVPDAGYGTIRGLTKLFGGNGRRKEAVRTASSSRSASVQPPPVKSRADRPKSIDVLSVNSNESVGWTSTLTGTIKGISGIGASARRDSRASREPREPVEMSTRHDKDQLPPTLSQPSSKDPQESEWNKFLVRLMKSREQAGEEAKSGELVGASRWGHEGNSGKQKLEMLTRLVVGGIPMRLRHPIWMELSDTYSIMQPDAYKHYLTLNDNPDPEEIDAILKDVPRTLTSKYDYYAEKGYDRLKKVLIAFVNKYPGLGYTQGLNMIAGYLLLAIPDESDAFWVLCNMVDHFFPPDYFSKETALSAPISDTVVLRQYVRELLPKLSDHLTALDISPQNTVPLSWFLTAFASVLPESLLLRIWDVWLCLPNQKTFLFNVALTLLQQHAKELLECETQGEYFAYMTSSIGVSEEEGKRGEFLRQAFLLRRRLEGVEVRRAVEMKRLRRSASTEGLYDGEGDGGKEGKGEE
ncbi:hypothetical protein PRZ48_014420 [Zasmidium cellare]|uniref:Rab-GAP TBC domain-containing protein n=1 Tax=Zasmidium cellare TaxID=395010 RepID=A0ABR0DY91_ZASCE|nr:hypothetical protein PRZ48_014420 [Zasmidium cellare]